MEYVYALYSFYLVLSCVCFILAAFVLCNYLIRTSDASYGTPLQIKKNNFFYFTLLLLLGIVGSGLIGVSAYYKKHYDLASDFYRIELENRKRGI